MQTKTYQLLSSAYETADIKRLEFTSATGATLTWTAGAHVRVLLTDGTSRAYSLLRLSGLSAGELALGVLLEKNGQGGSRFMHALKRGDKVQISDPVSQFAVQEHDGPAILIAGGVGITPILSMADELARAGRLFEAHYAGRSVGKLAFVKEMQRICGDRLFLHYDDQDNALDIGAVLNSAAKNAHLYFCGPTGMIEAIKATADRQGFPSDQLHYELFSAAIDHASDTAFDVVVKSSGQVVHVAADKTIIEALEDAGLDPLYDCKRGDCGICQCEVIEGEPDHRDVILSDAEKASGKVMQICVSRSKTPRLVLDI
ncbi:oxidoreductase [Phyllobacterium phragmitis]|uniref:Oxidoreductase n=1 Tax=Phyllobacterium phragmitis TaxID=2670329 RepID=A0A2S9ISY8_9HYPH|nr:PDR/VanB family oxidoreductase [Phyllobacterium phragmitis]PRD43639.1 oxidoreductase [Phyllobacterium phragmitis]